MSNTPPSPLPPKLLATNSDAPTTTPANIENITPVTPKLFQQKEPFKLGKVVVGIMIVLLGVTGYLGYDKVINSQNEVTLAEQATQIEELKAAASTATTTQAELEAQILLKDGLLQAREGFIKVLADYNVEASTANGNIDITANQDIVNAAREKVFAERENSGNIDTEAQTVKSEITKIQRAMIARKEQLVVDAKNAAETERIAKLKLNETGTLAEQALDEVSGGAAAILIADDACPSNTTAGEEVTACVSSDDPLTVRTMARYANDTSYTYESWRMVMTHEYGHVIQFSNYEKFVNSQGYINAFNKDIEWYADCMAKSAIGDSYTSGYAYSCNAEQLNIGAEAFKKNFL
jgi:hypothetical protein